MLLLALALGRKFLWLKPLGKPVPMAEFFVPDLRNWTRATISKNFVTYRQERDPDQLFISLRANAPKAENARKTVRQLQQEIAQQDKERPKTGRQFGTKQTLKVLPPEIVDLNGIAAVKTPGVISWDVGIQYIDDYEFIKSSRLHFLTATISVNGRIVPAPPANYQRDMDDAMKIVIAALGKGNTQRN